MILFAQVVNLLPELGCRLLLRGCIATGLLHLVVVPPQLVILHRRFIIPALRLQFDVVKTFLLGICSQHLSFAVAVGVRAESAFDRRRFLGPPVSLHYPKGALVRIAGCSRGAVRFLVDAQGLGVGAGSVGVFRRAIIILALVDLGMASAYND